MTTGVFGGGAGYGFVAAVLPDDELISARDGLPEAVTDESSRMRYGRGAMPALAAIGPAGYSWQRRGANFGRAARTVLLLVVWVVVAGASSAAALDGAGSGVDREQNPLTLASTATASLSPGGDPFTVVVVNLTTAQRVVAVKVDVTEGAVTDVRFQASDSKPVPASGSLKIPIAAVSGAKPLDGFVVVTDAKSGQVIRQQFAVTAPTAVPAITSRDQSVALRPWPVAESRAGLEPLPLKNAVCPTPAPEVMLTNGDDDAKLTTTCRGGSLAMTVGDLDAWSVGDYTGKLVVGDTDVSITLTKRAPLWLFLVVVVFGIVLALVLRSFLQRKPLESARKTITALGPEPDAPAGWTDDCAATTWLRSIVAMTKQDMLKPLSEDDLWASRKHFKWLLAPSTVASQAAQDAEKKTATASALLKQWNAQAPAAFERLASIDTPATLGARAKQLTLGQPTALVEPVEPGEAGAARAGVDGLTALLAEAKAISGLDTVKTRLDALSPLIGAAPPTLDGTPLHRAVLQRAWVSARVEFDALQALLARTFDARTGLDNELLARVKHLAEDTDKLVGGGAQARHSLQSRQEGVDGALAERGLPEASRIWQLLPGLGPVLTGIRGVLHHGGELIGEVMVVLLAVAVVVVASYSASYAGASWGTGSDLLLTFIGAAGGTVVLTPLISALDRLAGKKDAGAS